MKPNAKIARSTLFLDLFGESTFGPVQFSVSSRNLNLYPQISGS